MNVAFEVQYLSSLGNVNRRAKARIATRSTFNVLILMLGFTCILVGYSVSYTPRARLADFFDTGSASIERSASAKSFGRSVREISKTIRDLVR